MANGRKTGGRKKGTPNADTPIKVLLKKHSLKYYTPDDSGQSQFDRDAEELSPRDRAMVEAKLLEFHTPKMQATSVDVSAPGAQLTIEDRLIALSQE